jgi:hypothetical protein
LVEAVGPDRARRDISEGATSSLTVAQLADQFLARKASDVTERT